MKFFCVNYLIETLASSLISVLGLGQQQQQQQSTDPPNSSANNQTNTSTTNTATSTASGGGVTNQPQGQFPRTSSRISQLFVPIPMNRRVILRRRASG